MKLVSVGDVTELTERWEPRGESFIEYLDIESVDRDFKVVRQFKRLPAAEAPSRARQAIHPGDIVVSNVRPNLNAVAQVPDHEGVLVASTGFTVLRPNPAEVDARYLYHFLRSPSFVSAMAQRALGASYPAVSSKDVCAATLPLPSLTEQRRIAATLDTADAIRRKRAQATRLTDDFLRTIFIELFGDPMTNPRGWPTQELLQVADIGSGLMKGRPSDGREAVDLPYLRVANVQDGYLDLSEIKSIPVPKDEVEKYRLHPGDVLMTEGGDYDKLGRGAVWRGEIEGCVHQNHVYRIRPHGQILKSDFLSALSGSNYGKAYFMRCAKQTTGIATINKTQLGRFPILLPPLPLQEKFGRIVARVETLLGNVARSTAHVSAATASLQEVAFSVRA